MNSNSITWNEYFMAMALLSAQRSKDPSTKVGACIVNSENKIVGVGYNGMPTGCSDDALPWSRTADSELDTKYPYVCHAELNAILNSNQATLKDCTLYVTLFPCNSCAKAVIQSGIKKIVYYEDKYADANITIAAKRLFDLVGIEYIQYTKSGDSLTIEI